MSLIPKSRLTADIRRPYLSRGEAANGAAAWPRGASPLWEAGAAPRAVDERKVAREAFHAHRIAAFGVRTVAAAVRELAKRVAFLAAAGAGTGRACADVGWRVARHRRHLRRALGGDQEAVLARLGALHNPSFKVGRDHVAPADDRCDPFASVARRIFQDRRNA